MRSQKNHSDYKILEIFPDFHRIEFRLNFGMSFVHLCLNLNAPCGAVIAAPHFVARRLVRLIA